jgi:eukaryotic-like serine/threonine-protein kinase
MNATEYNLSYSNSVSRCSVRLAVLGKGFSMIGKTLGHYHILEKIGQGGMGEVFLAEDTSLQRKVALKFLPPGMQQDPSAHQRFMREAKSAAALDHPYICHINEVGEAEGKNFIVMEYVEGQTLKDRLAQGPLSLKEAQQIGTEILEALGKAHENGILHRDLKPTNVMLTREGHAKVMDFGLAKQLIPAGTSWTQDETFSALTQRGTISGTLAYMSPEQLQGRPVDARSDIFSFGIVLYEMLAGVHPFGRASAIETASAILTETPLSLDHYKSGIPRRLQDTVTKLLSKNLSQRYQTAHEVHADFGQILLNGQAAPASRRRFGRIWFAVAFIVLVFGVVLLSWWVCDSYFKSPQATLAFQERDWMLMTNFENLTGDEVFDKSLDTALRVSIEQSSFVNLYSHQRIAEVLRRMKRPDIQRISEAVGREIAEREGIKVLLVPSITGIASTYMLSASLQDPRTASTVKSEIVRAQTKEKVLDALDELARSIRRDLGESVGAISRRGKPLAKVTTSSLDALKQYSLGIESHRAGKFEEARAFYESALREDPNFTAAMASLGMIDFEKFDKENGKTLLSKAVAQVGTVTDRERFGILAFYARAVENNLPAAIQHLKACVALYPDDSTTHNNLGHFYRQMKRYDDSVAEFKEAIRIDPTLMISYNGLAITYLDGLGDMNATIELSKRQISQDDRQFWAYDHLGWAYLGKGDLEQARIAFEKALELDPKSTVALFRLFYTYRLQKYYLKALEALKRIQAIDTSESIHYHMGLIYQSLNDRDQAHKHFELSRIEIQKDVRTNPKDISNQINLAIVRARLGQVAELYLPDSGRKPLNPKEYFLLAQFYSIGGKTEKAMEQLELAIAGGFNNYVYMKIHPNLDNLAADPRFQALLRQHLK